MTTLNDLTYRGKSMADVPLGELRRTEPDADIDLLHERMAEDGYLLLTSLLDRAQVLQARRTVLEKLVAQDLLDLARNDLEDGVVRDGAHVSFAPDLARDNPELDRVLYEGPMIAYYERFLGGPVRHFDYTWFRAKTPGTDTVTQPHYDIVFMGRGTTNLWTSWTPLSDVPYEMGGLVVLEGSHQIEELRNGYGATDVDRYCDRGNASEIVKAARAEVRELTAEERQTLEWQSIGHYSADAIATAGDLGGRWLTSDYKAGDLLVLSMYTMHASSDNRTNRIRLSSDSRYQLASDPVDERWVGDDPPLHGVRAKRATIC
ncbi:MAG: phytanoyl-CoA dioxygenase family protein [Candidatus Latescibacterota bacterium]|nr:phytanoyl-CoA dioxygenase family protein [Candidatus Latescibacterota bacterium]